MPCPDPYRYFASKCWRVLDDATGPAMLPDDRSLDEMSAGVHSFLEAATLLCAGDRALVTEMVLCGAGSARDVQLITCEAVALARAWANKGGRCSFCHSGSGLDHDTAFVSQGASHLHVGNGSVSQKTID